MPEVKIAIVHDWFIQRGGAELCIKEMLHIFPQADIYALFDFFSTHDRAFILSNREVKTSSLQKLPFIKKYYRKLLSLYPKAIEQFDLRAYDLIISSSHSVAKGVLTNSNQVHICYCYSPMRYAWDLYFDYLEIAGLTKGPLAWYAKKVLHNIRIWDQVAALRPDSYVSISKYIQARISKVYRIDSKVVYPPVDLERFKLNKTKKNYYLAASRLVPYKRIDLIVQAFKQLLNLQLLVVGDGPEYSKISKLAGPNVTMLGYQDDEKLVQLMQEAKAFIFAAEEDFGIIPIEAQACGTPVIAYAKGGSLETVSSQFGEFFYEQNAAAIADAILQFEKKKNRNPEKVQQWATKFDKKKFRSKFKAIVEAKIQ